MQEQNLDAAVKYIDRTGGVAGRKLQLVTCDDGGDIARGRAWYEKLKGSVFALTPSITWLTDTIHDKLAKDKVPWMWWGWFTRAHCPSGARNGGTAAGKKKGGGMGTAV